MEMCQLSTIFLTVRRLAPVIIPTESVTSASRACKQKLQADAASRYGLQIRACRYVPCRYAPLYFQPPIATRILPVIPCFPGILASVYAPSPHSDTMGESTNTGT